MADIARNNQYLLHLVFGQGLYLSFRECTVVEADFINNAGSRDSAGPSSEPYVLFIIRDHQNRNICAKLLERRCIMEYNHGMELSIVVPAFEESKKIARDVEAAAAFLAGNGFAGEIIIVDDGSKDNTSEVAEGVKVPSEVTRKVIRYEPHRGKGYAVRTGMKESSGEYVMFADSGLCVPYEDVMRGLELLKTDTCDITHGSRKMRGCHIEKPQSLYRRICSRIFHWFVIYDMKIPAEFTDTQCGFKMYKGDVARHLYGECITDGFTFDIEIIMRAQKEGYRIKEFPIDWTCDRDSRLSPTRSSFRVLAELMAIRRALSNKQKPSPDTGQKPGE